MTIQILNYFIAAVECGSFTQAAEKFYTTQPNFSKQIASLEKELGVTLFYREHRRLSLTHAGRTFYEMVKDIPAQIEEAQREVHRIIEADNHTLRIGVLEGHQLSDKLLQILNDFHRERPEIKQHIARGEFIDLREGLLSHSYDVVFTILFTVQDPCIQSKILHEQSSYVAVNQSNPLSEYSQLTMSDLKGADFVILNREASPVSHENLMTLVKGQKISYVSSTESLFTSVEAGLGIAIVDNQNRLQCSPHVKLVPLISDIKQPDFGIAWKKNEKKPAVIDFLRQFGI